MSSIDRYAVMGNPIQHSKSPQIHAAFAAQTGHNLHYSAILVEPDGFQAAVTDFISLGGKGLNITVPFKQQAWQLATVLSPRAQQAEAVNTFALHANGTIFGDNTDGIGLIRDLTINHQITLSQQRILLLGAGGAARGVVAPLLAAKPNCLIIANRTLAKAKQLATSFDQYKNVSACGFADLHGEKFNLIINATAASLQGHVPPIPDNAIAAGGCCYDMMYADHATPFMRWGTKHHAKSVDGRGMLVEQAAESFYIWRKIQPLTANVIASIFQQRK